MPRQIAAEALGTAALVLAVVGSGIMAQRLTTDPALALLCNSIATGAALVVLVTILAPISGAHFNPVVTLVAVLQREMTVARGSAYVVAQVVGGIAGTLAAHAMFALPLLQVSTHARTGLGQWLGEVVATAGLLAVVLLGGRARREAVPMLVGLYIAGAYWFTSSTSFANPAVTIARSLTDTFAGIAPADVAGFVVSQLIAAALVAGAWRMVERSRPDEG